MTKKNIIISISVIGLPLLMILFIYIGWSFGPGSYPYAEIYEFNLPEDSLISVINKVKQENPDLTSLILKDGRQSQKDYWFDIYFYYKDKNKIIKTWTRPITKQKTVFAFVATNDGLILGNWKEVNSSFWWWKNKPEIEEFEQKILNKIKSKLSHN